MKLTGPVLALLWLAVGTAAALAAATNPAPYQAMLQKATPQDAPTGWDKSAAAKFLDDRMELWFKNARKLRTGQGTTTCVSCHTVVPYTLARAALRPATGTCLPTPLEARLLEETLRRVDTYGQHEPMVKDQVEQSRGTESVLNLLILTGEDARQNRLAPSAPTRRALEELWDAQRYDGAWNWVDTGMEPYESSDSVYYGAALAAIAVGRVPDYGGVGGVNGAGGMARLRAYLNTQYADQNLYNRVWMLLASARLAGLLDPSQIQSLSATLQTKQNTDGGWSLYTLGPWTWSKANPPYKPQGKTDVGLLSKSDSYATGLITYALRQAGTPANHPSLKRAIAWLEANQQDCQIDQNHWKCWRTYSLNHDQEHGGAEGEPWRRMFMSEGATAFAALALLSSN